MSSITTITTATSYNTGFALNAGQYATVQDLLTANSFLAVSLVQATAVSGLNLTAMGGGFWRLRNGTTNDVNGTLSAYLQPFSYEFLLPAGTDTFVSSPYTTATHILQIGNTRITKANRTGTFSIGLPNAQDPGDNYSISGGGGDDSLGGGEGQDTLIGGAGNDILDGSSNNDSLIGGAGDDNLIGGDGNDTLSGGTGNDTLIGGDGDNTFLVTSGSDTIEDLGGTGSNDVLVVSAGATLTANLAGPWTASSSTINNGTVTINTGGGAIDLSSVGGTVGWTVNNNGSSSSMTGSVHADTITGGLGGDTISGGNGADWISGGSGTVTGSDNLDGGDGNDTLHGGDGNDTLTGGAGIDSLDGGAGNDLLTGGAGNDTLTGGAGTDRFTFNNPSEGLDTITDFINTQDFIQVSNSGFGNIQVATGTLTASLFSTSGQNGTAKFIYSGGVLSFDSDLTTNTNPLTQIATLTGSPVLTAARINVIA